jgi:hypothetical protein
MFEVSAQCEPLPEGSQPGKKTKSGLYHKNVRLFGCSTLCMAGENGTLKDVSCRSKWAVPLFSMVSLEHPHANMEPITIQKRNRARDTCQTYQVPAQIWNRQHSTLAGHVCERSLAAALPRQRREFSLCPTLTVSGAAKETECVHRSKPLLSHSNVWINHY